MTRLCALELVIALAFLAGCVHRTIDREDPNVRAIIGCGAGVLSKYGVSADLQGDLGKAVSTGKINVKAGFAVEDWMKTYIFEQLPEKDRLGGYKEYLKCYEKRSTETPTGLHSRLLKTKEESQRLWNEFTEAEKLGHHFASTRADAYAITAASFKNMSEEGFNLKSQVVKNDRQALMYFIAAEIIIRSGEKSPQLRTQALEYAEAGNSAARAAREVYEKMLMGALKPDEAQWLESEQVNLVTLDRLAEGYAQLYYLEKGQQHLKALRDTLSLLPCDYIANYKLRDEPVYKRIGSSERLQECSK